MSHYLVSVLVSHEVATSEVLRRVDELLAPFDEDLGVESFVAWNRELLIQKGVSRFESFKHHILAYAYQHSEATTDEEAIQWFYQIKPFKQNPHPAKLWYRDEVYEDLMSYLPTLPTGEKMWSIISDPTHRFYDPLVELLDENDQIYSGYNPNSKWDWYVFGGRWEDDLVNEVVSDASFYRTHRFVRLKDLNVPLETVTYALVDLDGNWQEPGEMGWFGCSSATPESKENYQDSIRQYLKTLSPDTWVCFVDCHI